MTPEKSEGLATAAETKETKDSKSAPAPKTEVREPGETTGNSDAPEASEEETEVQDETLEAGEAQGKDGEKPKKNGFKKRIDKLTSQKTAAEQERDYWKQEALKRSGPAEPQAPKQSTAEAKPKSDGAPDPNDFDNHADFVRALTKYEIAESAKAEAARAAAEKRAKDFQDSVTKFKAETPDFDETLEEIDDLKLPTTFLNEISNSENPASLMYALAKDRAELERISKLPVNQAIRELGRFEARIAVKAAAATQEPKTEIKKSSAPPPIEPVKAKSSATTKSPEDMDYDEFKAWRNEQTRRRR